MANRRGYERLRAAIGHRKPSGNDRRRTQEREFVGWDGEGVTDGAHHRYVLLANSRGDYFERSFGMSTVDALDFLLDTAAPYKSVTHVVFGGSYDATKILADLTREQAAAIYRNESSSPVHVALGKRLYAIDYRPRKYLRVARFRNARRFVFDPCSRTWKPNYDSRFMLWDVLGFFQQTFIDAARDYSVRHSMLAEITSMKKQRGSFDYGTQRDEILRYCLAECEVLELLARELWRNFTIADIRPARFDGAGAAAAALLRRENVKESIALEPAPVRHPVASAFFGGRIELVQLGINHVHGVDIASAYPSVAADLPSMVGTWAPTDEPTGFSVLHVRYEFPLGLPWYPLPYRNRRDGTIVFADAGEGWYWRPEVEAALRFAERFGGRVDVIGGWRCDAARKVKPFGFVPQLYEQRAKWKREGNGAQLAAKLALNSLYGKSAQQVGARPGKLPPYLCLPWAGWITASTRARLVDAALHDPEAVVAFATDGIYSTRPLDLHYAPGVLGAWERSGEADGVFVQAGVYWLREGERWKARYRGFDKETMTDPAIALDAWRAGEWDVSIPTTRFVTFGSALVSKSAWEARGTWVTTPRVLNLTGRSPKRLPSPSSSRPDRKAVRLVVRANEWYEASGEPSAAYDAVTLSDDVHADRAFEEDLAEMEMA